MAVHFFLLTTLLWISTSEGEREELPPCGKGWVELGPEGCYWFERRRPEPWKEGLEACRDRGGSLLSLSDLQEAELISEYLKKEDLTRSEWLTSGRRRGGVWEWEGAGGLVRFPFWATPPQPLPQPFIIFTYYRNSYRWTAVSNEKPYPYICERSRATGTKQSHIQSAEKFGSSPEEIRNDYRRPVFLKEPVDSVFYSEGPKCFVVLKCRASGHPQPEIAWFKGGSGKELEVSGKSNKLRIGGNLVFLSVNAEDYDSYFCTASNSLGTIRSRKAFVRFAYVKEFSRKRLDIYATSGLGKSVSCLEPDHYPRSLGFGWMFESVKTFLRETERIFISRDGTLYFAFLQSSDQNEYSCNIVSSELQTGHYGPFFKLQVSETQAGVPTNFKPQIPGEFLKIFPPRPQLGEPVYVECFAYGNPPPKIRWERLEGSLPHNSQIKNFNRALYFPSFSPDDQGTYRCTASNTVGTTAKQITLNLNSPPKFLTSLGERSADQGTAINFRCQVFGQPEPDYEWFFNGSPINPLLLSSADQERIEIAGNRLVIRGAKHRDSGIYQCIATNSLGQASSAGFLSIRNFRPNFDLSSEAIRVYAAIGKPTELKCNPEGSPRALISWLHEGRPLGKSSRVSLTPEGSLSFSHVKSDDAGQYVCSASSSFGTDSQILNLVVMEELEAEIKPGEEVEVGERERTTLTCKSSFGPSCGTPESCPEPGFSWTFNGQPIKDLPQFKPQNTGFGLSELNLRNVGASESGVYMCRIDSDAGHTSKTVRVNVKMPPRSPIQLKVRGTSSRSAKLSWTMPFSPTGVFQGELDAFRIEYFIPDSRLVDNHSKWEILQESIPAVHPVVSDYVVEGLRPFTFYQFRISAHNSRGWSRPSGGTQTIQTLPAEPSSVVEDIAISSHNLGDILVSWRPLKQSEWNDAEVGYILEAGPVSNASLFEEERTFKVAIDNPHADSFVIDRQTAGFNECTSFEVTLIPFNSQGKGPLADPVQMKGSFSGEADPVRNFSGYTLNSTHAIFFWNWQDSAGNDSCHTIILGFMLSCVNIEEESWEAVELVGYSGRDYNWTLGGLRPGSTYKCSVTVLTEGGGKGEASDLIPVTTYLSAPLKGVAEFYALQGEDEESLQMDWTPVPVSPFEEPLDGYKIVVYSGATSNRGIELDIPVTLLDRPSSPSIKIQGLESMKYYRSQIQAYSRGGLGPPTRSLQFRFGAKRLIAGASQAILSFNISILSLLFLLCFATS